MHTNFSISDYQQIKSLIKLFADVVVAAGVMNAAWRLVGSLLESTYLPFWWFRSSETNFIQQQKVENGEAEASQKTESMYFVRGDFVGDRIDTNPKIVI